jgi:hypothetical protein
MPKSERFTLRLYDHEKQMLNTLAIRLHRNPSDAIRFLIRQAVQELGPGNSTPGAHQTVSLASIEEIIQKINQFSRREP